MLLSTLVLAAEGKPWNERVLDSLPWIATLLTALFAAVGLVGLVRSRLRNTLWRRRESCARLKRLAANAQLTYFTSVLGDPPATRRSVEVGISEFDEDGRRSRRPHVFTEAVYIDRDFYVHTLADADETVQAFSVTSRNKRFKPEFCPPGGSGYERRWPLRRWDRFRWGYRANQAIKLGKTRFIELGHPDRAASWVGAHNAHYFEAHYLGNPGHYQTFVYSINDAGAWIWTAPFDAMAPPLAWGTPKAQLASELALIEALGEAESLVPKAAPEITEHEGSIEFDGFDIEELAEPSPLPEDLQAFRRRARVNTYTVIGPDFFLDDYPGIHDPHSVAFGVTSYRIRPSGSAVFHT
jgi:hypothetical protein